ncbi:alpha/beta hydrolase [Paenibacillus sp. UMB7766-LJ446]|uniref:poly(ethylene terephthalate) hydrolase family protein n=1 Tax=Paenibacillus sp. UMB7766-LJ446 TaxID=3046313 RepID=UPI00254D620C|nr:alpha/beta hydrolase [Paenibacillus sp. UMB7766-LJ446]MDK8191128.1 alpha/beta hydrolase [Paenibacillus sp. UMB7766-LJ446]
MPQVKKVIRSKWFLWITGVVVILIAAFCALSFILVNSVSATFETGSVEERYALPGTSEVDTMEIKDDHGEKLYRIYSPQSTDVSHPLIAWGNGTGALPDNYDELLRHLASWGFIVIDTYSQTTGTGKEIMAAIEYMLSENEATVSPFYHRIQKDRVGAAGHSQGSTGVINAHTNFENGNLIKTVVSIALPELKYCDPEDVYNTSALKVPFFVMGGTRDFIISPSDSNQLALRNANPDLPALMAMAKGAAHTAIEQDGGQHRGYLTAWMRYQLMDDSEARGAFVGNNAEIETNDHWKDVTSANLQ